MKLSKFILLMGTFIFGIMLATSTFAQTQSIYFSIETDKVSYTVVDKISMKVFLVNNSDQLLMYYPSYQGKEILLKVFTSYISSGGGGTTLVATVKLDPNYDKTTGALRIYPRSKILVGTARLPASNLNSSLPLSIVIPKDAYFFNGNYQNVSAEAGRTMVYVDFLYSK